MSVIPVLEQLKSYLDQPRYLHIIGVGTTARDLAKLYQVDEDRAELAGWLHDCARCYPISKLESIWHQHPGYLDKEELAIPALWHAPVSALIAQSDFKVADPGIIAAIRYHPTGRPRMSSLEKIIFVADYLEPNRKFKEADSMRKLMDQGLDQITFAVMESKLAYHRAQGYQLHSRGIAAYEYMKTQINR